jgi:hypothetical protein
MKINFIFPAETAIEQQYSFHEKQTKNIKSTIERTFLKYLKEEIRD